MQNEMQLREEHQLEHAPKGVDWLLKPGWISDCITVTGVAQAKELSPQLLSTLERAMVDMQIQAVRRPGPARTSCTELQICGVFHGSGPGSCQKLTNCSTYD